MKKGYTFDMCSKVICEVSNNELGDPNPDKLARFKEICEMIDNILEESGKVRFTATVEPNDNMIDFILDLRMFGPHPSYIAPIELMDVVKYLEFDGVPAGDKEGIIPEVVRLTFGVDGVWD